MSAVFGGIGDYGSSSSDEDDDDLTARAPQQVTGVVKTEAPHVAPVPALNSTASAAPAVKVEPGGGGAAAAVPVPAPQPALSDSSSESSGSSDSEDGSESDDGDSVPNDDADASSSATAAKAPAAAAKLALPPPDFDGNDTGAAGIHHQYRDHCGCTSCETTRWRRVHHDESLEQNVVKRKAAEREEEERKKRQRIRENLKKRGIHTDPTAMSKVQNVTGVVLATQEQTIVSSAADAEPETGGFQAENKYARLVRQQRQAKEAAAAKKKART